MVGKQGRGDEGREGVTEKVRKERRNDGGRWKWKEIQTENARK